MKNRQPHCIFLNENFGQKLTGIEFSILLRSKIFIEYLKIKPTVITTQYNPQFRANIDKLIENKQASKEINFVNLYDVIQGFTHKISKKVDMVNLQGNLTMKKVEGYKDIRYLNKNDKAMMYVVYDKTTDDLSFINYFNNSGKIFKRDKYHCNGYLSSTQHIDISTNEIMHEILYNNFGKVVLIKYFIYKDKKNLLSQIHTFDENGAMVNVFFSDSEFITYALSLYIESVKSKDIVLVSDRSKFLFLPSLDIKEKFSGKNISVIPVIHSTHTFNEDTLNSGIKSHYADVFKHLDKIQTINVFTSLQNDDIKQRFDYDKSSIIPHTYFKQNQDLQNKPTNKDVVYIARFSPEKNHSDAIKIFDKVVKKVPDAKLHFYGYGGEEKNMKEVILKLKLENSVIIHDYATNIEQILSDASLSILTSKTEGFCLSLLESIACGCPAVSYDIKYGPAELINNENNGYLVPYGDKEEFAQKVIDILSDDILQKRLSTAAVKQFDELFSPSCVAKLWDEVIHTI